MRGARALPVGLVLCAATQASAQLKPEVQTGSVIPVAPKAVEAKEAGVLRKHFAQCVYRRATSKAVALLNHSDAMIVDIPAAGIKNVSEELGMDRCLGNEVRVDQSALSMKFPPTVLRDLLAEEDYLAKNPVVPKVDAGVAPLKFVPLSLTEQFTEAPALSEFGDCTVRNDAEGADALLRTMPASDKEYAAAAALAPTLGKCLTAGQKVVLKPNNIRAIMAFAMWSRFARGSTIQ